MVAPVRRSIFAKLFFTRLCKYRNKILIPIFCLFLWGCNSEKNTVEGEIININVNQASKLSDFFDSFSYIQLESHPDCLITGIDKLIINDELVCILDRQKNAIYIFDLTGKRINTINKRGRGPGEYLYITDIQLYDSVLFVLDRANARILTYSISGEWQDSFELDNHYNYFQVISGDCLYLYSDNSNNSKHNFVLYDLNTRKAVRYFDPFNSTNFNRISPCSPFNMSLNGLYVTKEYNTAVFELTQESYQPKYTFKFNTSVQIPRNYYKESYRSLSEKYNNQPVVRYIEHFYETDDRIILTFPYFVEEMGIMDHMAMIDNQTKEIVFYRFGEAIDSSFPFALTKPLFVNDKFSVNALSAMSFYRLRQDNPDMPLQDVVINEMDNHILFVHYFKHRK